MSFLTHLECSHCGGTVTADELRTFCRDCDTPYLARYDLVALKESVKREEMTARPAGMWRWREVLPIRDPKNFISLGEGDTPLLPLRRVGAELGLNNLFVKEDGSNPTGSFKARGLSAAVSCARELGATRVIIPITGNAGGAMAAYAARAGMEALVIMPADTPRANIEECKAAGAQIEFVEGLISNADALAAERSKNEGWFDVSTFKEPYRVEGKKIMGYEVAEGFGWVLPEVIVYPTGEGTGLVGMWKAFAEMEALGWLDDVARPRMVAVQSTGCAPVIRAFEQHADTNEFWEGAATHASGLRVPKSFADRLIMSALYESDGMAVAVSEDEIRAARSQLAQKEGIFAAPEGAATLAGLQKLVEDGWVKPDERVVLFNSGTGLKYLDS